MCLKNEIDGLNSGYLKHMPGTAMDGGMNWSTKSLLHNSSNESIEQCCPQVKVNGTLIEKSLFHDRLVLSHVH